MENKTGKKTGKSRRKKGPGRYELLRRGIMVILVLVMLFSGGKLLSAFLRDKKAENQYRDIQESFVKLASAAETSGEAAQTQGRTESYTEKTAEAAESTAPSTGPTEEPTAGPTEGSAEKNPETGGEHSEGPSAEKSTAAETAGQTAEPVPQTVWEDAYSSEPLYDLEIDFAALKQLNPEAIAWLQGLGNELSYPVAQGEDNEYYLSHFLDGSYNGNGTLFADYRNHFLEDDVTYIYGHHMYSGAMFGGLSRYDSKLYMDRHPFFRLYTPESCYRLDVILAFYGDGTEPAIRNFFGEESFHTVMAGYTERAMNPPAVPALYGEKLVCLCTCAYHKTDGRYFVLCKVTEE